MEKKLLFPVSAFAFFTGTGNGTSMSAKTVFSTGC
jgi:hypothetical protein